MEKLYETVTTMDPMTLVTELNEEMLSRSSKILTAARYASFMGFVVAVFSLVGIYYFIFERLDIILAAILIAVYIGSLRAAWYSYQQLTFLMDFQILASAITRGMHWNPQPQIPNGKTMVDRFIEYLKQQDDRFDLFFTRNPEYFTHNIEFEGKSKKTYQFDGHFSGGPKRFDPYMENIDIFIRQVPVIDIPAIETYREDIEDVLNKFKSIDSARFFLIQSEQPDFSDEIIEYVNTHYVNYWRGDNDAHDDWKSPIEIIAEDPNGRYNIGSFYFG